MKFKTILTVAFLAAVFNTQAQNISIGPSVGFQHSWISSELPDSTSNTIHPGFNGGVSLVYSTESHLGLGADLKYSTEGTSVKTEFQNVQTVTDWNTSYIRLPIRLIYFLGEYGHAIRPKIFLGPTLGVLLSSKSEDVDVKEFTNGFDFGVHGGVGLNIRLMERIWLNTDVTYTQGLSDVTVSDFDDSKNHNGNIALNAGLLFGF
ncbi:MAG: porin family protein [Chitinophagales bacterium]